MQIEQLMRIDRRIVFLLIGMAVIIPLLFPIGLPTHISKPVQDTFNAVDSIPPNGPPLLLSVDYAPATMPELHPMTLAILRHCFLSNIRVILMTLHQAAPGLIEMAITKVASEHNKKRGKDYAFLGFKPGLGAVVLAIGEDIHRTFPTDYYGAPIDKIPMMKDVHNYEDIALVITLAGWAAPELWMMYAKSRYQQDVAAGVTAVSAADYYPFLQTKQLVGLLGGMKGAAEYEELVNSLAKEIGEDVERKKSMNNQEYEDFLISYGKAGVGMDAQSISHIVIILLIILGNVIFFMARRKSKET